MKKNYFSLICCIVICLGFATPIFAHEALSLESVPKNLIQLPITRQATDYTCGIAALQSILYYYGDEYNESTLAKLIETTEKDGTSYHKIADFSKKHGYQVKIFYNMTLKQLQSLIDQKIPIIVLMQAWRDKPIDYTKDWDDGHYAIAIGYDQQRIYFMDPSTLGNYTYIPTQEFLTRWHDMDLQEHLQHFGMSITKKDAKLYDPSKLIYLE